MSHVLSPAAPAPEMLSYTASEPPAERPWSDYSWAFASIVALAAAITTAVLFPGDISWINDEPRLLAKAWHSNAKGELCTYGLMGNFQITYGPVATHIYQLMLLFTHDPFVLAPVRAGLSAGVTTAAFCWMSRSLRMNPWLVVAVAMAPFLWVFHRIMWDASFAIPVGSLGLAAYAAFLRSGNRWSLGVACFCTMLLPFIHPMSAIFAGPLGVHALWRNHRALLRHWVTVCVVVAIIGVLEFKYVVHVVGELIYASMSQQYGMQTSYSRAEAALAPFLSGRILAGHHYVDGSFDWNSGVGVAFMLGKMGAYVVYPLIWAGFVIAGWRMAVATARWWNRPRRDRRPPPPPPSRPVARGFPLDVVDRPAAVAGAVVDASAEDGAASTEPRRGDHNRISPDAARDALAAIAFVTSVFQLVVFGFKRVPPEPQYYFGTFPAHVFLAWLAIDAIVRFRPPVLGMFRLPVGSMAALFYAACVSTMTVCSIWHFHARMLGKDSLHPHKPPFPTMREQVRAAEALNAYLNATVLTDIEFFQRQPQALRGLRLLLQPKPGTPLKQAPQLFLRWGDGPHGPQTQMEVIEVPPVGKPEDLGPGVKEMNVTPLPDGWFPEW